MTTEQQRPENESATSKLGEETVALARRHSEITKRLTRKQTERRIDELEALAMTIPGAGATSVSA